MSAPDQAVAAVLSQIALAADDTVLSLALAFIAVRSVLKFKATNSALHQIKEAPSVRVSDLRSVVSEHGDSNQSEDDKLVIVRGTVEERSAVEGVWKSLRSDILVAHDSGERAVIVQRTQTVSTYAIRDAEEYKNFCDRPKDQRPTPEEVIGVELNLFCSSMRKCWGMLKGLLQLMSGSLLLAAVFTILDICFEEVMLLKFGAEMGYEFESGNCDIGIMLMNSGMLKIAQGESQHNELEVKFFCGESST
nr:E3 ubiquitin-protein ligase SPL2 [Ipomoea batatas]